MVDARVDVEFGQALIGKLGPAFAPALDHLGAVPVPHLLAKTVLVHRAHGQHDMGMGFGHAVLGHVPMHIEIGDHAPIDEFAPERSRGRVRCPAPPHLARDGEFDLAGKLGVLADFERLDIVPQPFAVAPCLAAHSPAASPRNGRRRAWRKNRGCDQAARRAAASPSGRRLTPPRWSQTCGQ